MKTLVILDVFIGNLNIIDRFLLKVGRSDECKKEYSLNTTHFKADGFISAALYGYATVCADFLDFIR